MVFILFVLTCTHIPNPTSILHRAEIFTDLDRNNVRFPHTSSVSKMQNTQTEFSVSNDLYRGYSFNISESFKHQRWVCWAAFSFHPDKEKKIDIIKKVTNNNLLYIIPNTFHSFNLEIWHLMHCQMPQWGKGFLTASLRLLIGNWFHEHWKVLE